jgi:hypothetical protein
MCRTLFFAPFFLCAAMFDAVPINAQTPAASNLYVFPLFVDGSSGGVTYRSTLKITKTSTSNPMPCQLIQRNTSAAFTGIAGYFYPAEVFDGGFSPPALTLLTLDQFLPFEILRSNGQSGLKTGYATLSCAGTVQTQLQFSLFDAQNTKLGEATILPGVQGHSFRFLIDTRDGTRLGFSLTNHSAAGGQFALVTRDQFNYEVDRTYAWIDPWSQVSHFFDEMLALPANFVGTVEIVGLSGGRNYAIGLQFTGPVFTTVQPFVAEE